MWLCLNDLLFITNFDDIHELFYIPVLSNGILGASNRVFFTLIVHVYKPGDRKKGFVYTY